MISEEKILRYYSEAVEQQHPSPDRAVFGRIGLTKGDTDYDKDGKLGLFGVSSPLVKKIGMDVDDNADSSFQAMMHYDLMHISAGNDVAEGMAKTAGESDVDKYTEKLDDAAAEYAEKIEWEDGKPVRFKDNAPDLKDEDVLDGVEGDKDVKSKAKELTSSYTNESKYNASLGLEVNAKAEYDRLMELLKGTIAKLV